MTYATNRWRWLGLLALVCAVALPAQAQRAVTLRLNTATIPDTLTADAILEVRGANADGTAPYTLPGDDVIDWSDASTLEPVNVGGDYWEVTFQTDDSLTFKFWSQEADEAGLNTGWESGANNWSLQPDFAAVGDTTLPLHFFNLTGSDQEYDWRPYEQKEDSVAVWFRVFMNTESAVTKGYEPASEDLVVGLRGNPALGGTGVDGSMIDWGGVVPLERESDDTNATGYHLWSGVMYLPETAVGETQTYKFYMDGLGLGDGGYEDGNDRSFVIPAQDTTLHWVYFSNSTPVDPSSVRAEANVLFETNIEPLEEIEVYSRARGDQIQVRGSFNGFSDCTGEGGNPDACVLFEDAFVPTVFSNEVAVSEFLEATVNYKYFIDLNFENPDDAPSGWEEPLDFGGGNRTFPWGGEDPGLGTQFFNDIRPDNVIPTGTSVEVTFQVDMNPATDFVTKVFNPETDIVQAIFEDPIWIYTQEQNQGVEELDDVVLTDEDGDGIYTGTFTVVGPTYNGLGFRYTWGPNGDETTEGSGGFDPGRRRYQYVLGSDLGSADEFTDNVFSATYALPVVTVIEEGDMPFECNPTADSFSEAVQALCYTAGTVPTNVDEVEGELPQQIALSQNYPNPFNPATTFEYAITQAQPVAVRVFDMLGRQVATLVDGVQPAGTYRVTFDASDLASGLYLYQLQTPTQVITKQMMLVK